MHVLSYPETLSAVIFGQFGLEEHALVTVAVMGAVSAKLLRRTASFGMGGAGEGSHALTQDPSQIQLMVRICNYLYVKIYCQ